jgi:hypothetical protein
MKIVQANSDQTQLLSVGRPITFGTEGNYTTWAVQGWSQDKDRSDITWMDGHVASLEFLMSPPTIDLLMVARMKPFVTDGLKRQQLQIYLNGLFVDLWSSKTNEVREYSSLLKRSVFSRDSCNTLSFAAPNAISPVEAELGPDERTLSFAFMQITLQDPTRRTRFA